MFFKATEVKRGLLWKRSFFLTREKQLFFRIHLTPLFLVKGGWRRMQRLIKSQRNSHVKNEVADEQRVAGNRWQPGNQRSVWKWSAPFQPYPNLCSHPLAAELLRPHWQDVKIRGTHCHKALFPTRGTCLHAACPYLHWKHWEMGCAALEVQTLVVRFLCVCKCTAHWSSSPGCRWETNERLLRWKSQTWMENSSKPF